MAADAGIFQQYLNPVRSVADYRGDMDKQEQNALTLAAGRLTNQTAQQAMADDQASRQASMESGGDSNRFVNALQKAGLFKQAQAYQKASADIGETQGKVNKQKVELVDAKLKQSRQYLDNVTTPEQYIAWHEANHQDPILGPALAARGVTAAQARASIMEAIGRPGGFEELLNKSRVGIEKFTEMNKPTVSTQNLGGTSQIVSTPGMGGAPTVLSSSPITQTPDSVATNERMKAEGALNRANQIKVQGMIGARQEKAAAADPDGTLPEETLALMAQQYRAGDTSVMQNLGRGAQGAKNIIRLRNKIAEQTVAEGKGGADLAAQNAEYFGTKAGQRTAGTRIANVEMASNEAESLIPLAREASANVARSGLLPFGKAQIMFDNQTNDPNLRKFAAANNALVNVYSRAISPSGVPTVADKEHAREMISTAMDQKSYNAVLDQMQQEITAARAAPQAVRKAFNAAVTGKGGHGTPATPTGTSGVPADISALLSKHGGK